MIIASVSQSVSYFTVPPRAHPPPPVRRLSETPSGFAAPGQTQVPSVTRVLHSSHSHWNTAVIEDLPRCPTTYTRFPSHSVTAHTFPSRKPSKPKSHATGVYDACAARYPGRDEPARMRHCYPSFYSRPRFPQYPYSNILDYGLRGISHPQSTIVHSSIPRPPHMCMDHSVRSESLLSGAATYTPFGSHTLRSLYTVRGPLWAVVGRPPKVPTPLPFTSIHTRVDGSSPITHPHLSRVFSSAPY